MEVCRTLAGYSYGRADLVRKAMSKKKMEVMEAERKIFIYGKDASDGSPAVPGAVANGVPEATANAIFDEMAAFAEYAFNKAHATAYAIISYQTAYLKCHYPQAYFAALMTSVIGHVTKVAEYIDAAKAAGVPVYPPDVNKSQAGFSAEGKGIRFGLTGIKGVGGPFAEKLVKEREENGLYKSFFDFCTRLRGRELTRRTVEGMVDAGALDCFGGTRQGLNSCTETMIAAGQRQGELTSGGQLNLFSAMQLSEPEPAVPPEVPEYPDEEKLEREREALGVYLSSHPLEPYRKAIAAYRFNEAASLLHGEASKTRHRMPVRMLGRILSRRLTATKGRQSGRMMCFAQLEDLTGVIELVAFPGRLWAVRAPPRDRQDGGHRGGTLDPGGQGTVGHPPKCPPGRHPLYGRQDGQHPGGVRKRSENPGAAAGPRPLPPARTRRGFSSPTGGNSPAQEGLPG